ncbi:hypothetical protein ACF061_13325 [Streptomyces sp. NPDC015220]|uniref:hypothetical protein n=1 Tax=Streptomyces sp. NPDC015220 TaxID=3364947 RepID=UPI003702E273
MPPPSRAHALALRPPALVSAVLTCTVVAGALAGCGGNGSSSSETTRTPPAPNTASFTGTPPSALASSASAAISSARASASAAASSASARASEFEASVSAESARRSAAAEKALKDVKGRGNALGEVAMTGLPKAQTGGVLAVLVTITNKTDRKASYAVRVDFEDAGHHVVETRYTGAENLEAGQKQQPIVFSTRPPEQKLTARLAKAERY